MEFATTDLSDANEHLPVAAPLFTDFGGTRVFAGPIATVKTFEDNVLVRATLETPGHGRVLVVDAGGSTRRALVGDNLAQLGVDNGWSGIVINGCVRDTAELARMHIGVRALGALPKRSDKLGTGQVEVPVTFAGVTFEPGAWLYADADGILVSPEPIHER
jgi:regulator of ribonuclease activity A